MRLTKSRYQTQSKPETPETEIITTPIPPNLQTFNQQLLSENGFFNI